MKTKLLDAKISDYEKFNINGFDSLEIAKIHKDRY